MQFKNPETKREWRIKNREKQREHMRRYQERMTALDPDFFKKQAQRKAKDRILWKILPPLKQKHVARIVRNLKFSKCFVCGAFVVTGATTNVICEKHSAWNCMLFSRVIQQAKGTNHPRDPMRIAVINCARAVRLMSGFSRSMPERPAVKKTLTKALADCASAANTIAFKKCKLFEKRLNSMAGALNKRKGNPMEKRITAKELQRKLEEQSFKCAYTGEQLTPENLSADHFVPVSEGGDHTIENLRLVTREINRAKGSLSFDQFVAMCESVVRTCGEKKEVPLESGN